MDTVLNPNPVKGGLGLKKAQLHPTRLALLDKVAAYLDGYRSTMAASLFEE